MKNKLSKSLIKIFREKKMFTFYIETDKDYEWMVKHMQPTSMCWNARKNGPITIECNFTQYQPTTWELFKDWFSSKIYRRERYWKKEDFVERKINV